jgi:hypothetical protein
MRTNALLTMLVQRLRLSWRAALLFATLGTLNSMVIARLPEMLDYAAQHSAAVFAYHLFYQSLAIFVAGLVVTLGLRLSTANSAAILRSPLGFLWRMLCAASVANLVGFSISHLLAPGSAAWQIPAAEFLESWLEIMLWGSLLGWLYFLYLQRQEDQQSLAVLLSKRALLARQLAHSELSSARAHLDPMLLTRVLRSVHAHYPQAPAAASALLDQFIAYLRLAMQRKFSSSSPTQLAQALQAVHTALNELEKNDHRPDR